MHIQKTTSLQVMTMTKLSFKFLPFKRNYSSHSDILILKKFIQLSRLHNYNSNFQVLSKMTNQMKGLILLLKLTSANMFKIKKEMKKQTKKILILKMKKQQKNFLTKLGRKLPFLELLFSLAHLKGLLMIL